MPWQRDDVLLCPSLYLGNLRSVRPQVRLGTEQLPAVAGVEDPQPLPFGRVVIDLHLLQFEVDAKRPTSGAPCQSSLAGVYRYPMTELLV